MNENVPPKAPDDAARRSFLMRFAAVVFGGLVALFPFVAGFGVIIDPYRRSRRTGSSGGQPETSLPSSAKLVRICSLDELPADGVPRSFPVITDVIDGWTHAVDQRVGLIFLSRTGKTDVVAFNAACPHLGCFVDFNTSSGDFECPCHKSAFAKDGKYVFGPSRRGLDSLDVKLEPNGDQTEILVAFQNFESGIAERKPIE